jgi:hypothetical protein
MLSLSEILMVSKGLERGKSSSGMLVKIKDVDMESLK